MRLVLAAVFLLCLIRPASAQPLNLRLPTDNAGLLEGDLPGFYQYTDRTYQGRKSTPWQGGQYGFVRNLKDIGGEVVYARFHEGLDIKPMRRNPAGDPLDAVRAIDEGTVVYTNNIEKQSSYGLYVVVEHWWDGSPFYSLYAHLGQIRVQSGQQVARGTPLGRMGYTGRGIDQRRAHVHFEINMLLNERFERWHNAEYKSKNHHGIFNGINLAGIDASGLYLIQSLDSTLTISSFLSQERPAFYIAVPKQGGFDLLTRYPWLATEPETLRTRSWTIGFSRSGLPLTVTPSERALAAPIVVSVAPSGMPVQYFTNGYITGSTLSPQLTRKANRYLRLLMLPSLEASPPVPTHE